MRFRLVALDIDGTLLDTGSALRPAVRAAVAAVRARGVRVVLCTGRRPRSTRPVARELGLEGAAVCHHGALVKDLDSGDTMRHEPLSEDVYRAAVALVDAARPPIVYVDEASGGVDIVSGPLDRAHPVHRSYLDRHGPSHRVAPDLSAPPEDGALVLAAIDDEAPLRELLRSLETSLAPHVTAGMYRAGWGGHLLELMRADVSKWSALRVLAGADGIAPEEILAIGDERNDTEMVRHAGLGVAMGNAREEVKAVADHVTTGNDEDGVARALARFVLDA